MKVKIFRDNDPVYYRFSMYCDKKHRFGWVKFFGWWLWWEW